MNELTHDNNGQFTPTRPSRLNATQLNFWARLANNASSVQSSVTSQCWWRHCIVMTV